MWVTDLINFPDSRSDWGAENAVGGFEFQRIVDVY
jgi:hypothetical protein